MINFTQEKLVESIKTIETIIKEMNTFNESEYKKRLEALNFSLQLLNEQLNYYKGCQTRDIIQILGQRNFVNANVSIQYKSIVFCVIDAIFSIRAKYNPTIINVLDRTANVLGLHSRFDKYKVSDFLHYFKGKSSDELANYVFGNRQRTSSVNGILKSEAVTEALKIMHQCGIETIDDFNDILKKKYS